MEQMKELVCKACGVHFVFTQEEANVYALHGFVHAPMRCPACRGSAQALEAAVKPKKEMYEAICECCGKNTRIPFKPKGDKPVYCLDCFKAKRKND